MKEATRGPNNRNICFDKFKLRIKRCYQII